LKLQGDRVRRFGLRRIFFASACTALLAFVMPVAEAEAVKTAVPALNCGGAVEADVWHRWDRGGFSFVQHELLDQRLVKSGDTYALYDFQVRFHNLLAMAQRCRRLERELQLVGLVTTAYAQLVPMPNGQPGRGWICLGGSICNSTNRLVNTEVALNSTQFLAFATSLANGLSRDQAAQTRQFVELTASVAVEHLRRWSSAQAMASLRKRIAAVPGDVKDGSSALFLLDRDLWQIAIYANLAGVLAERPQLATSAGLDDATLASMKEHLSLLLRLVAVRTTVHSVSGKDGKAVKVADLDAGFWRLFEDNRYAGYAGRDKPVVCSSDPLKPGTLAIETRIEAERVMPVTTLGWDISHARRLVHFFDAIEQNRAAVERVFGVGATDLPSRDIMAAFARQLEFRVWNQDKDRPLFSNYFSGANGWYRVAYDNGTGRCVEGYPPYGLTDAFATGGYATWGSFAPKLREIGVRLYALTRSTQEAENVFVRTYYPSLGDAAKGNSRMLAELMFWPTLVQ
jgi:hypothetical protein